MPDHAFSNARWMRNAAVLALTVGLAACEVGPDYDKPDSAATTATTYKEANGMVVAVPADTLERGPWYELFGDPVLNNLATQVEVSNQNLAAAEAAYRQARAMVTEQRAQFFPTITLDGTGTRSGSNASSFVGTNTTTTTTGTTTTGTGVTSTGTTSGNGNTYRVSIGATWELDVWGRIRRAVEEAKANAEASESDLFNAKLSAQGELATDYFELRDSDIEIGLLKKTIAAYERSLTIARNRYNAGIAIKTDLLQAESQLATTKATLESLVQQRGQLEHAIAVLCGQAPSSFSIAALDNYKPTLPQIPTGVPSQLLLRRPDIAAAERRAEAASAAIGVAVAALYPDFSLSADGSGTGSTLSNLFSSPLKAWSLGFAAAETIFDGGANSARVEEARAAYEEAVATYRQTVLTGLANVEDQLIGIQVLNRQYDLRKEASSSADQVEQIDVNRYNAGQIDFTDVVVAQATALSARQALAQAERDRLTTTVALIQALGGGWNASKLTEP